MTKIRSLGALLIALTLLVVLAPHAQATMPGKNGRIAFNRNGDIYTVAANGTGLERLTRYGGGASNPKWSPDGRKIAFVHQGYVWTMNANGSGKRKMWRGTSPAWSPDGRQLAYVARHNIWMEDLEEYCPEDAVLARRTDGTGGITELNTHNDNLCYPQGSDLRTYGTISWARSGTVYFAFREDDIRYGGSFTGIGHHVPHASGYDDVWQYFSGSTSMPSVDTAPSRPNVAFSTDSSFLDGAQRTYVWSTDKSFKKQVTPDKHTSFPVFAPTGTQVLYTQRTPGQAYLVKRITLGSAAKPVTLVTNASQPDWQPLR